MFEEDRPQPFRPVFDSSGHRIDIFTEEELKPVGGGAGLVHAMQERKQKVQVVDVPKWVAAVYPASELLAVEHSIPGTKDAHEIYVWELGLRQESMIIPLT